MERKFCPRQLTINFVKDNSDVPVLKFIKDDPAGVDIQFVDDDGMANHLWRVQSRDKKCSVILKYGEESLKSTPEEKISLERQVLEYRCLKLMQSILPGCAPEPYCFDKNHHIMAMEDMSGWELLGVQIHNRHIDLQGASHLGQVLARLHRETSQEHVSQDRWQELKAQFQLEELKEFDRAVLFERPYVESDPVNKIPDDILEAYRIYVEKMKTQGLMKKLNDLFDMQKCFVHGDCHTRSIFIKDGRIALFDFELAFLGHPASNLAFPVAAYVRAHLLAGAHATDTHQDTDKTCEDFMTQCVQAVRNMMESYLSIQTEMANDETALKTFLSEVALFTGGILFMATVFIGAVHDIRAGDRAKMLDTAFQTMERHESITNLQEFLEVVFVKS